MNVMMQKLFFVICVLAGCGLLVVGGGCAPVQKTGSITIGYHYTQTQDNMTLALRRYRPEVLSAENNPVILCHGLGYNMLFWDLADEVSLARYLAGRGYDVWVLSLRGACPSSQPPGSYFRKWTHLNLDPEVFRTLEKRLKNLNMIDWSVDDHIDYDVSAALSFVREQTGYEQAHWVGHSMGGMVMLGYLGKAEASSSRGVKSFVAVAVPAVVFHPLSKPFEFLLDSEPAIQVSSIIIGSSAPATVGMLLGDINSPTDKLFYNSRNVDSGVLRKLFSLAQEEISAGQLEQLLNMVRYERFESRKRDVDYTASLANVVTPTLFLAGTVDNLATAAAVKYAYREVACNDKEFRLFGRVNSHRNDYGHDDLVIGEHARSEVYPVILRWLDGHKHRMDEEALMLQPIGKQKK